MGVADRDSSDGRDVVDPQDDRHASFDHIVPVSRGGADSLRNLRLACRGCNSERGSQMTWKESHRGQVASRRLQRMMDAEEAMLAERFPELDAFLRGTDQGEDE